MAAIQIRVGASLDRSTATIFQQLADQAKRANRAIADEARKAAKEEETAWKAANRELARMEREAAAERKKAAKDAAAATKAAAREEERVAREKVQAMVRIDRELTRSREREAKERAKAEERAANDAARAWVKSEEKRKRDIARGREQTVSAAGGLAYRGLQAAGRFGVSVLSDMAQGAGVRLDMGSHFAAASDLETRAIQLSNSGYMPGTAGANGRRQDPRELMAQAYSIGNKTGTAANEVMGGLQAFVGKTGDLESGRSVMEHLAKLSKATGANLEDMADAAADVSNNLGDVPDKGERVKDVMMAIAGQGKVGAVEIKDLASQMAKVAANATMMAGDAGQNIKLLGAFAQESRAKGGSASATQAAQSVASTFSVFSKGARLDAFHNLGVQTSDQASGKLRKLDDILLDTLVATQRKGHGNVDTVNKLFGSTFATEQARRGVKGFEKTFRETYASTKGTEDEKIAAATKAYREELEHLLKVQMSSEELQDSFAEAMKTGKSQAEIFNNQLQEIAQDAQSKIGPALIALAPVVIDVTKKLADFAAELFGIKKPPAEVLDAANASAARDVKNVKKLTEHPDTMTPEQRATARAVLMSRRDALSKAKVEGKTGLAQQESGLSVPGTILSEYVGNAVSQTQQGNYLSAAFGALPLTGVARAVYKTATGTAETQRAEKGNVAAATDSLQTTDKESAAIDEQLRKLDQIDKTLGTKTLKVEVVNLRGGGAGGGQNRGLEPTE